MRHGTINVDDPSTSDAEAAIKLAGYDYGKNVGNVSDRQGLPLRCALSIVSLSYLACASPPPPEPSAGELAPPTTAMSARPRGDVVEFCGRRLRKAESIVVCDDPQAELSPIRGLSEIRSLKLTTHAADLRVLGQLPHLALLDLTASAPSAPHVVGKIATLEHLRLDLHIPTERSQDGVVEVDGAPHHTRVPTGTLDALTGLRSLTLRHASLPDLTGIEQLEMLEELDLGIAIEVDTANLSPLGSLWRLRFLDVSGIPAGDLASVGPLHSLRDFVATGARGDLPEGMAAWSQLERMTIRASDLGDLGPLTRLHLLVELDLSDSKVADVAPIGKIESLQRLVLRDATIDKMPRFTATSALEVIDLSGSRVSDLSGLDALPGLEAVVLGASHSVPTAELSRFRALMEGAAVSEARAELSPRADRFRARNQFMSGPTNP